MLSNLLFLYVIPLTTHVFSFFAILPYPLSVVSFVHQCSSHQPSILIPLPAPFHSSCPLSSPISFTAQLPTMSILSFPILFLHIPLSFLPPPQVISGPGLHPHWVGGVSLLIVTVINISKEGSWDTENLCTGWLTLLAISVSFSFDQPLCSSLLRCLFTVIARTPVAATSVLAFFWRSEVVGLHQPYCQGWTSKLDDSAEPWMPRF